MRPAKRTKDPLLDNFKVGDIVRWIVPPRPRFAANDKHKVQRELYAGRDATVACIKGLVDGVWENELGLQFTPAGPYVWFAPGELVKV